MKTLAAMMVLIGLCFLAQSLSAQYSNVYCESLEMGGKFILTDLPHCISAHEDALGKLFAEVVELKRNLSSDEKIATSESELFSDDLDHLHGRIKELELELNSQGTCLDKQQQKIEDLQKQIDTMRAELVKKPRPAVKKTQAGNSR
jgi:peptidoglycan hydrolase CwlO-like protein